MKKYLFVDIFRNKTRLLHMLNTSIRGIHYPLLLKIQKIKVNPFSTDMKTILNELVHGYLPSVLE